MKVIPGTVSIGYVHTTTVKEGFARSLAQLCLWPDNKILGIVSAANPRQEVARNAAIETFLGGPTEWLMWIDTDQTFKHDAIERMLATAKTHKADMVTALAFIYQRWSSEIKPSAFLWNEEDLHFDSVEDFEPGRVYEISGCGSGCTLVNRRVFEAWDAKYWHQTWTKHPKTDDEMGHDLAFCYQATQVDGFKLVWDTGVPSGHIKDFELDEKAFRDYQEKTK